ncbi:response regulator [Paraburkholderia sp. ZP32-5]|uniref:response regulator n=1 Tax=Paraburkholderia sp. ZP32-5 TaxID=2883245 RepID=UPI001F40CF0B|nr:response regulator [Paraburkholderia sp. ZP32-5]
MDTVTPAPVSKVFLVDDATEVRVRLARLLALIRGVEIAGACGGVGDTLGRILASQAHVVVLDPCFAGETNLRLIKALSRAQPSIISIVLTNHGATAFRRACQAAGADFFFDKTAEFGLACRAIEAITHARRARFA